MRSWYGRRDVFVVGPGQLNRGLGQRRHGLRLIRARAGRSLITVTDSHSRRLLIVLGIGAHVRAFSYLVVVLHYAVAAVREFATWAA